MILALVQLHHFQIATFPCSKRKQTVMRHLLLLVLIISIGCGSDETADSTPPTGSDSQQQPNENSAEETTAPADGALNDAQVAAVLAQYLGQWEGTAAFKDPDGKLQAEFPLTNSCRWLEDGKLIEMRITEKQPQGDQEVIITKWYDRDQKRFLLTRRMASDEATTKPGAYETYDPDTGTFHGTVTEGIPAGASVTWTAQFADQNDLIDDGDKFIVTGSFQQDNTVQSTRIDTLLRESPEAETP